MFVQATAQRLKKNCICYFHDQIQLYNVCSFLELAMKFEIQTLYKKCINICREAAFLIMEFNDFYCVSSKTVLTIISQPRVNVHSETELFYDLWIKATMDCCRHHLEVTCENIAEFFKPYSVCLNLKNIDEQKLKDYNNSKMITYYQWKIPNLSGPSFSSRTIWDLNAQVQCI